MRLRPFEKPRLALFPIAHEMQNVGIARWVGRVDKIAAVPFLDRQKRHLEPAKYRISPNASNWRLSVSWSVKTTWSS